MHHAAPVASSLLSMPISMHLHLAFLGGHASIPALLAAPEGIGPSRLGNQSEMSVQFAASLLLATYPQMLQCQKGANDCNSDHSGNSARNTAILAATMAQFFVRQSLIISGGTPPSFPIVHLDFFTRTVVAFFNWVNITQVKLCGLLTMLPFPNAHCKR